MRTSIGQKEIDEAPPLTTVEGDEVVTSRHMENIMAPPFWRMALRGNNLADDVPVDRWQICRFTPPSHVLIEVGVAHAGKGGYHADPQFKASSIVVDFITPANRDLDLVLLGHGAQLQSAGRSPDREHPRRSGQDFQRGPGDARAPADRTCSPIRSATC